MERLVNQIHICAFRKNWTSKKQQHTGWVLFTFYWKCLWNPNVALLGHWQKSKGERDTLRKCLQLCWLLSLRTEGLWLQSPSHTVRASSSRFKHDAAPFTQRLQAERIAATAVAVSSEAQQHREVKGQTQLSSCLCGQARYSESHHTMEKNISLIEIYMRHQRQHSSTTFSFFSFYLTLFYPVYIFRSNVCCCQNLNLFASLLLSVVTSRWIPEILFPPLSFFFLIFCSFCQKSGLSSPGALSSSSHVSTEWIHSYTAEALSYDHHVITNTCGKVCEMGSPAHSIHFNPRSCSNFTRLYV